MHRFLRAGLVPAVLASCLLPAGAAPLGHDPAGAAPLGQDPAGARQSHPDGAPAAERRAFPLERAGATADGLVLAPDRAAIAALATQAELVLEGLVAPGGRRLDLALHRLDPARLDLGFEVDGTPRPDLLEGLELSIWAGTVVGEPASRVLLSFSRVGSRGWITGAGPDLHLVARPGAGRDWTRSDVLLVEGDALAAGERGLEPFCAAALAVPGAASSQGTGRDAGRDPGRDAGSTEPDTDSDAPPTGGLAADCGLKECRIALETDHQLYDVFESLAAETAYMTTLLAAISDRYEEQIGTVLTFPYVQFWTTASDPWTTPDHGGSTGALLDEFRSAWQGAIPEDADLAHFVSGANLGGGIAYVDVLCAPAYAFGVSAGIGGDVIFPVAQRSGNWDFMVIAHELGHNFSAPHTHDLSPPVDDCASGGCISSGTVMSYCHLCPGGTANVTTYFHERSVELMAAAAQSCLADYDCGALEPGLAACFGVVCPCGNPDAAAGCATSTGAGARLSGTGSASVATGDLVLTATGVPGHQQGLLYMGNAVSPAPFFDGRQCAAGTTYRFPGSVQSSGASGTLRHGGIAGAAPLVAPGGTWHFQFWFRDQQGPCGTGANLTNLYSVVFAP